MDSSARHQLSAGEDVPVIAGSPMFGAARDLQRDLLGTFERAMLAHGGAPVRFRIGPPRLGFVAEAVFRPEDARQVLATDAVRYDKRVPALEEFRRFVGDGLLTSDGDRWRRDRRIVAPLFTRKRIASYVASMSRSAEGLASSWGPVADRGAEVDLREPSMLYALDVLGTTVFGEDMDAAEAVVRSSVPVLNEQVTRTALSPVRLPSWFPITGQPPGRARPQGCLGLRRAADRPPAVGRPSGIRSVDRFGGAQRSPQPPAHGHGPGDGRRSRRHRRA